MVKSSFVILALLIVTACGDSGPGDADDAVDEDGDGFGVQDGDCDDDDPNVHPDADELCDGIDNDCDRGIDEPGAVDGTAYFLDTDGDGYGDPDAGTTACWELSDYVLNDTDCDDTDSRTHPGVAEYCDGHDDDCDGEVDEDSAVDGDDWYRDSDGDGYGDPDQVRSSCERPDGYTGNSSDCDDGSAEIHPGGNEICDGVDNDCDGWLDATGDLDTSSATWGDYQYYFEADTFIGTVFEAEQDMVLQDFAMFLAAFDDVSGYIQVLEYDGVSEYNRVAREAVSFTGDTNFGWRGADDLDVQLIAGGLYIMGFGSSSASYYPGLSDQAGHPTQLGLTPVGYTEASSGTPSSISVTTIEEDYTLYQQVTVEMLPDEDRDDDQDGVTGFCGDCNPRDSSVYPDAPEICDDGVDQNCDGADASCSETGFVDSGLP